MYNLHDCDSVSDGGGKIRFDRPMVVRFWGHLLWIFQVQDNTLIQTGSDKLGFAFSLTPVFRHRPGHSLPVEGLRKDELFVILLNNSKTVCYGSIMGVQGVVGNEGVQRTRSGHYNNTFGLDCLI